MNSRVKNLIFWVVVGLFMILLFNLFTFQGQSPDEEVKFSEFVSRVEQGDVREVTIRGNYINGLFKDGRPFRTYMVEYPDLVKVLRDHHVTINAKPPEDNPWHVTLLVTWGPFILFLGLWFFLMRQMQIGGNKALSFGRSRARLLTEDRKKVTFSDVAGIDEAKEEVVEIIEFLKDPHKFQKLGGRIPKGVLIVGPPGTGKTLLAKAIAGEAGVPFFSISGSDFVEMFVGVGASRVRDLFEQGKKHAPCIIFIDEIDAVGRLRGAGLGGGHDEREQTLNQLLVEMDGFDTTEGVILIAATNRPDVLDPALLRPGRFDRQITVERPDVRGGAESLKVHTKKVPLAKDVNLEVIPRGRALGVTMQLPVDDRHSYSKEFLYNNLAILMGGRVAEELVFKQITTGAGNDIERATDLARKMVCEWGMSDELGPLTFGKKDEEIFLGREIATRRDYSEEIALKIDSEVKRLVTENYERAKRMLRDNMAALKALAEALLEKEVLEAAAIDQIIQGALSQEPQGVSA